jgi:Flp pilus assembly protein TadB
MSTREISLDSPPAIRTYAGVGLDRLVLIPIVVGLLTAASILLLIYQENRAVQYRIEATEVWSAYQLKVVQGTVEEDPNLKAQYTEEQDALRQQAQDLRAKSSDAKHAVTVSNYAALLLLLGAGTAVFGLAAKSIHAGHVGLVLGIIGVGLGIRALF